MAHAVPTVTSLIQPVERWHIIERLQKELAKETKTSVEAVKLVTEHTGNNIFLAAQRAQIRCPGEGDWLGTAMACNAASNKTARRLIEDHARHLWNAWVATLPV